MVVPHSVGGYLASWGGMRATAAAAAVATVERSTAHIVDSIFFVGRATTFLLNNVQKMT